MVKNLPAIQEIWVQCLGRKDPLEKGMVTHSIIFAWRIPWTEDLAGCSPWGDRPSLSVSHSRAGFSNYLNCIFADAY